MIAGKPLSEAASGLQQAVNSLKDSNHLDVLCLYASLDTIRTLASSTPTEREALARYCEGTTGNSNWIPAEGNIDVCYIATSNYGKLAVQAPDGEGLSALVSLDQQPVKLYQINTKTVLARQCFDRIKSKVIVLPTFPRTIIEDAMKESASVEEKVFTNIKNAKNPFTVLLIAKRPTGQTPNPVANANFLVQAAFFSPNDAEYPMHYQEVAGLLTQNALDQITAKPEINLDALLRNFGYQAIIVNDEKVDSNVRAKIAAVAAETGASLLSKGVTIPGFETCPE